MTVFVRHALSTTSQLLRATDRIDYVGQDRQVIFTQEHSASVNVDANGSHLCRGKNHIHCIQHKSFEKLQYADFLLPLLNSVARIKMVEVPHILETGTVW